MYKKALKFITTKHGGQKRNNGNPYIIHPIRVSQEVRGIKIKTAALLHDVIEDTNTTYLEVEKEFGEKVAIMVDIMTHPKGMSYIDYIKRIKKTKNKGAIAIKIADISDNLADSPSDYAIEKSAKALDILINS